jgi:hypothetical protein
MRISSLDQEVVNREDNENAQGDHPIKNINMDVDIFKVGESDMPF